MKGDKINAMLLAASKRAANNGKTKLATKLTKKAQRINARLDRQGQRINRNLEREVLLDDFLASVELRAYRVLYAIMMMLWILFRIAGLL